MKLKQAQEIAEALKAELKPHCERIEMGGSIRRKKPEPNDIELICIPKFGDYPTGQMSLEGDPLTSYKNLLFEHIAANRDRFGILKMGDKYAQIEVHRKHLTGAKQYIKVDIFTATSETWGYIFMLRTGSAEFSHWVVMELKRRGFVPKNGEILYRLTPCNAPDESDVFHLLELDYIEPEDRTGRVHATPRS